MLCCSKVANGEILGVSLQMEEVLLKGPPSEIELASFDDGETGEGEGQTDVLPNKTSAPLLQAVVRMASNMGGSCVTFASFVQIFITLL
jgi:hypothetical protein